MEQTVVKNRTRKSNGEGSIYQRKDGRWCAQIQIGQKENGKPSLKYFYGNKRKEVVAQLDEFKALHKGNYDLQYSDMTIDEYIIKWLTTVRMNALKPKSYDTLESTINNHIIPNIGTCLLSELTSQQIQENVINKMLTSDQLSYSTIKKAYNAINACYKYALINRHVQFNPVSSVVLPSINKFEVKEIKYFSNEEIKKIKEQCVKNYKSGRYVYRLGYGIILILNTGMRLGEALALKWSDVDLKNKTININKSIISSIDRSKNRKQKWTVTEQPNLKTKAGKRTIPLTNNAIDALEHLKEVSGSHEESYVFSTNNKITDPSSLSETWRRIIKNAEIETCGLHALRHTFASKLFEQGVDVKTVSSILGHSNVTITYNTYIHLIEEQKHKAISLLNDI